MASFSHETLSLARQGATLYTIQLGLNLCWMPLFFGFERPVEATADIIALLGTAGYLTYVWSKVDEVAAWIMVPYLGWLAFATYLSVRCIKSLLMATSKNRQAGCGYLNGWNFKDVPRKGEKTN